MSVPNAEKLWLRAFWPMLRNINDNIRRKVAPVDLIKLVCDLMEESLPDLLVRNGEIAVENIALIIKESREAVGYDHFQRAHDYLEGACNLVQHGNINVKDAAKDTVIQ